MKKIYSVTVNGKTYEVEIEEINRQGAVKTTPITKPVLEDRIVPAYYAAPEQPVASTLTTSEQKPVSDPEQSAKHVVPAPMPGSILSLKVNVGQKVKAGEILLILEAMKMENEITAPKDGVIKEIPVKEGDSVNTGEAMIVFGGA